MATREARISQFNTGAPPADQSLEILCEDHNGTYTIPYPCMWTNGGWVGVKTNHRIEATVLGWRPH